MHDIICKYSESKLAQEQKIKSNVVTKSCEKASSATLISSTPARRVADTKVLTATEHRAVGKTSQEKQSHASTSQKSMSPMNKGANTE